MAKKDPLVIIVWEDTTNVAAWQTRNEMTDWAKARGWLCSNVGWVTYEDDECVVLSSRIVSDEERHVGLSERIPKRAILKRTALKER